MAVQLINLRSGEKVDIVIRRHWIAFFFLAVYFVSGIVMTIILYAVWGFSASIHLLAIGFWMYFSLFLYISWLNYELDLFIFTNNRVICVEQKTFLNRTIGETTLDKVQEVGVETKGLLANLFDFGTLSIMTAGSTPSFDMSFSPHPMKTQRYINNLVDRYRDALYGGGTKEDKLARVVHKQEQEGEVFEKGKKV